MNLPFYAENSSFQLVTAIAFLIVGGLFFSSKRNHWEFLGAGVVCTFIAFDERFMFHECLRLLNPELKKIVHGDFSILFLSLLGIISAIWAFIKLSRNLFEKTLYVTAALLCGLEIYLDVFDQSLFYLELDVKIEEISELLLAIILLVLGLLAGFKKRFFIITPALIAILFLLQTPINNFIWTTCPKLKVFK